MVRVTVRPSFSLSSPSSSWICLLFLLSLSCISATQASPLEGSSSSAIMRRENFIIVNNTGTLSVLNPDTRLPIPQGSATDAGGTGFNIPASIWLSFSFVVGLPMWFAGFRGRLPSGVGVGLAIAVASWAAFINSIQTGESTDLIITAIVLAFFACGFVFGALEVGRTTGILLLGVTGGLAFGVRIMIMKSNLLISGPSLFPINWVLISVCGIAAGMSIMRKNAQKIVLLLSCTSIGTFLTSLGVDLIVNKQSGMSRGLRYLFDRNSSHILDIIEGGYIAPASTQIIICLSLPATLLLAYAKYCFFEWKNRKMDVESNPRARWDEGNDNRLRSILDPILFFIKNKFR